MNQCLRWHRLGELCICGYITTPARFYWEVDAKGEKHELGQQEAQDAYVAWCKVNLPEQWLQTPVNGPRVTPPVTKASRVTENVTGRHAPLTAAQRAKAYRERRRADHP